MKTTKEIRHIYKWDIEGMGLFECTTWNSKITNLKFCKDGSALSKALYCSEGDDSFLIAIYNVLGEMIKEGVLKKAEGANLQVET